MTKSDTCSVLILARSPPSLWHTALASASLPLTVGTRKHSGGWWESYCLYPLCTGHSGHNVMSFIETGLRLTVTTVQTDCANMKHLCQMLVDRRLHYFPVIMRLDTAAGCTSLCLFVGSLTSQKHASVSHGRICSENFTCCHTEIGAADPTFYLTQSQYTDTGPTSPIAEPITPRERWPYNWSANFEVTGITRPGKIPPQAWFEPRIFRSQGGRLNH